MSQVTIIPSGKTIDVAAGTTLLAAILAADETIQHKCEGNAKCGTCHIFVHDGRKGISRIGGEENARLDMIVGVGSKSRLACQSTVLGTEDIRVELLGFNSGF